jgi:hypothetical protein
MRVNSFIGLLVAAGLSFYAIYSGKIVEASALVVPWLVGAYVPKAIQKFAEPKNGNS